MVKNLPYSFELPHEWWSICDYADGLCPFSKIPELFYEVCMTERCSLKNYRKSQELLANSWNTKRADLTKKVNN